MKNINLRKFSSDIIFLILILFSFLTGYLKIAISLLTIVLIHAIIRIYLSKGKIKLNNKEETKIFFLVITVIYLINILVQYFLFNKAIPILMISTAAIIFLALYLFYRLLIWYDPRLFKIHERGSINYPNKLQPSDIFLTVLLVIVLLVMTTSIVWTLLPLFSSKSISSNLIIIDAIIIPIFIVLSLYARHRKLFDKL